jgi:oligopeptide transport system ATP-binding protein
MRVQTSKPPGPLLNVVSLHKHFPTRKGLLGTDDGIRAVDGVDLWVIPGGSFGLVGESGCGKTTLVRCILGLIRPTAGQVYFEGRDITRVTGRERRQLRARMQIVFQDPYSSLNPRISIGGIIGEPLVVHRVASGRALEGRVRELLDLVGLKPDHIHRFPHEFSGGQRQRIAIARALALRPRLLVLDEPTSALDVSVQAQILNLLNDLQQTLGLTYLMISHDLAVIRHMCDTVAVMHSGRIVEQAEVETIFQGAIHPYTRVLLNTVPRLDRETVVDLDADQGDSGMDIDLSIDAPLKQVGANHWVRHETP